MEHLLLAVLLPVHRKSFGISIKEETTGTRNCSYQEERGRREWKVVEELEMIWSLLKGHGILACIASKAGIALA